MHMAFKETLTSTLDYTLYISALIYDGRECLSDVSHYSCPADSWLAIAVMFKLRCLLADAAASDHGKKVVYWEFVCHRRNFINSNTTFLYFVMMNMENFEYHVTFY